MKRNKKGFTLIELLAVIVILAIIALIAVPVIMNIINSANKSAFKDTAYGIISAGELYFAERQLDINGMDADKTFTLPSNELDIKGEVPAGTILKVNTKGQVALSTSNGRYCITKRYEDTDIIVTEDAENCYFPYSLRAIVTETEDLEIDECLSNGEECAAGTQFAIQVSDKDTYKFRVLKDESNIVTLIMSSNLYEEGNSEPDVAYINQEDYETAGGKAWGSWTDEADFGPITALKALKTRTSNWTNLESYSYDLHYGDVVIWECEENGSCYNVGTTPGIYSGEYVKNVRAKLPTFADLRSVSNQCGLGGTCLEWLKEGLVDSGDDNTTGYWVSDCGSNGLVLYKSAGDAINEDYVLGDDYGSSDPHGYGVRPVITLNK